MVRTSFSFLFAGALFTACSPSTSSSPAQVEAGSAETGGLDASEVGSEVGPDDGPGDALGDGPSDGSAEDVPDAGCAPVDLDAAPGPSGYPGDGWTWVRHGVVLENPDASALDGYLAPALLVREDTLHVWWTVKVGLDHTIWHATSKDGIHFQDRTAVAGLGDEPIVAYPTVVLASGRFEMFYTSGGIDYARSDDGVMWTVVAANVLGVGAPGAFDALAVLYPSVIYENGQYVMYYTGFDGQAHAIGRATSADGLVWTRTSDAALIMRGASGDFDNRAAAQPAALSTAEGVFLWYGGYDTSKTDPGPYRVGVARADDGIGFEKLGVTLDLSDSGAEAHSTRDPSVVAWRDRLWMAYAGMGEDNRYRILMASSETCASFE